MNFAFPALVVFVLILPGFIFVSFYSRSENSTIDPSPFTAETVKAFLASFVLHIMWICVAKYIGYQVNFDFLLKLLINPQGISNNELSYFFTTKLSPIITYFGSIYLVSALTAYGLQKMVIWSQLDFKIPFLKFESPWFYLLRRTYKKHEQPDVTIVTFLMDTADGSYIYAGTLRDFITNSSGQLDRLIFDYVLRRQLEKDKLEDLDTKTAKTKIKKPEEDFERLFDGRYYEINADIFVAKYSLMKNLTVSYKYLKVN